MFKSPKGQIVADMADFFFTLFICFVFFIFVNSVVSSSSENAQKASNDRVREIQRVESSLIHQRALLYNSGLPRDHDVANSIAETGDLSNKHVHKCENKLNEGLCEELFPGCIWLPEKKVCFMNDYGYFVRK